MMGQARLRKERGSAPQEKVPKTYLWPRSFIEVVRERYHGACRSAKAMHFPPPSEDGFMKAVITAGFMKMDEDVKKAKEARAQRIVTPDVVLNPLPGGQPIILADR